MADQTEVMSMPFRRERDDEPEGAEESMQTVCHSVMRKQKRDRFKSKNRIACFTVTRYLPCVIM